MQMRVGAAQGFTGKLKPDALQEWFVNALAPAPEHRFQGAAEMREGLARALQPATPRGQHRSPTASRAA
jgi:hypothetical protein